MKNTMTAEKIVREIDARLDYLKQKRDEFEAKRDSLRFLKPYRNMSDKELDNLPHSSKFWKEWDHNNKKICPVAHEINILREMKYAYEHHD